MNPERKLVHTLEMPVRWGDMDALGHVNASQYFVYFEQARVEFLGKIGKKVQYDEEGPVVINAACTFLKQMAFPGTIRLELSVGQLGRSSFMTYNDVYIKEDPGVLYAQGESKVVWVNYQAGKSTPLPDFIRQQFN